MNLLSMLPFFPLYYGGNTKFTPIHVSEIAELIYSLISLLGFVKSPRIFWILYSLKICLTFFLSITVFLLKKHVFIFDFRAIMKNPKFYQKQKLRQTIVGCLLSVPVLSGGPECSPTTPFPLRKHSESSSQGNILRWSGVVLVLGKIGLEPE